MFFIGSAAFLIVKKDQILQETIHIINQSLTTPVSVDKIDFSIISNWPNASILLQGIHTKKQTGFKNTFITAGEIQLSIDLFSIFTNEYLVKEIIIKDATIALEIDKNSKNNYSLFKKANSTKQTDKKHIAIQKINLINSMITYEDYSRKQPLKAKVKARSLNTTTDFRSNEMSFQPIGLVELVSFNNGELILPNNQSYQVNADLTYLSKDRKLNILSGNLKNDDFHFEEIFGNLVVDKSILEISLKANDFKYKDLQKVIPEKYLAPFNRYNIAAEVSVALTFKGALSNLRKQSLAAQFSTKVFDGFYPDKEVRFTNHSFSGEYLKESGKNYNQGIIKKLKGAGLLFDKEINYQFEFVSSAGAEFSGSINGSLDGGDILKLYPESPAKNLKGNFSFSAHIQQIKGKLIADGELEVKDASFKIADFPEPVTKVNTALVFNNSELAFQELSGVIGSSDFSFTGIVINPANITKKNQPFFIDGQLSANQLYVDQLMGISYQKSSGTESSDSEINNYTPANGVNVRISLDIENLYYKRFYGRSLAGKIAIKEQKISSEEFSFQSIGGNVSGAFAVYPENNFLHCKINGNLKNLYADSIFYVFENFDQDFIEDKHLKGQISASIKSDLFLTTNLTPISQTLKSTIDASIVNGRLVDFPPMYRLSKFVEEEQLAELSFSKLTNNITIQNSRISIPEMRIESNISNIELSGWHSLDQNLEYHLKVPLKKKYKKDKDERFGVIDDPEKNVSNLFLKITGTTSDYKFAYDRIAVLNKAKADIKKEGKDLIKIFQQKGKNPSNNTTLEENDYFDFSDSTAVKKDSVRINQ